MRRSSSRPSGRRRTSSRRRGCASARSGSAPRTTPTTSSTRSRSIFRSSPRRCSAGATGSPGAKRLKFLSVVAAAGVPRVLSLAAGDDPRAVALVGAVVALAGAVLASLEERAADEAGRRDAVALAACAALLLGLFVFFLGRASQDGGALSALVGARTGSLSLLAVWAAATRTRVGLGRPAGAMVGVGLMDVAANALFALASREGLLAIVSVLGSLYPVPTVVLGHVVLGERISGVQRFGIALALAGVVAVAASP